MRLSQWYEKMVFAQEVPQQYMHLRALLLCNLTLLSLPIHADVKRSASKRSRTRSAHEPRNDRNFDGRILYPDHGFPM